MPRCNGTEQNVQPFSSRSKLQAERRRARYARDAVFLEFRYRDARAIDYDGFKDRRPDEPPLPPPERWF